MALYIRDAPFARSLRTLLSHSLLLLPLLLSDVAPSLPAARLPWVLPAVSRVAPPFPQPCRIVLALLHKQLAPLFVRYLTQPRPLLNPATLSTILAIYNTLFRGSRSHHRKSTPP